MSITTRIHLQTGDTFICQLKEDLHLTKNLQVWEVANNKAVDEEIKLEIWPKSWLLFELFQFVRDKYGKSITVNSGYRTKKYNASLPTASKNSLHLVLYALDLDIPYKEQPKFIDWVYLFCIQHGVIGGVNRYERYMHIDIAEDQLGHDKFVIRDYTTGITSFRDL